MVNRAKYYIHEIPEGYEARIEGNKVIIELAESEDERIRKEIRNFLIDMECKEEWVAYLEKQKEPHYTKRNALFDKCVAECDPAVMKEVSDEIDEMLEKEQKPASTEDMYIADEHFYERTPADSFKYKLAEYMTKNYRKAEGPYGHTYLISAETILKMAEEELLKRGVVQKPAEWSEDDEDIRQSIIKDIKWERDNTPVTVDKDIREYDKQMDWLKSLRPSLKPSEVCYGAKGDPDPAGVWKPSKAQIAALRNSLDYLSEDDYDDMLELYEQLKKLM